MVIVRLHKRRAVVTVVLVLLTLAYFNMVRIHYERIAKRKWYTPMGKAHLENETKIPDVPAIETGQVIELAASETSATTSVHSSTSPQPDSKVIVMAKLQHDDTDWVQEYLPDWLNAIYTVDNTSHPLSTPRNKGREANPYLLYIIQHYDYLPATIAFIHPHRDGWPGGWHTDAPGYDNVVAMRSLRLDFVQQNGYVNLRCLWNPGCPNEVRPFDLERADDGPPFQHHIPSVWRHFFGENVKVPEIIATPCCAQFAVSREQVLKRPLQDYQRYHDWLMSTTLADEVSGRIFEYLWHVIFGMGPV